MALLGRLGIRNEWESGDLREDKSKLGSLGSKRKGLFLGKEIIYYI